KRVMRPTRCPPVSQIAECHTGRRAELAVGYATGKSIRQTIRQRHNRCGDPWNDNLGLEPHIIWISEMRRICHDAGLSRHRKNYTSRSPVLVGFAAIPCCACNSPTDLQSAATLSISAPDGARAINASPGIAVPLRVSVRDGGGSAMATPGPI